MSSLQASRVVAVVVAVVLGLGMTGCESKEAKLARYYSVAASNRAGAATMMAADWHAKKILLDDCLNYAFNKLDNVGDANSTMFAGAVLDMTQQIEGGLPKEGEYELFWTRIGGLAGESASKAYTLGDVPGARSLVLGGPKRWQNEAFWMRHPVHDSLVARIMYSNGETSAALHWLRSRGDLDDPERKSAYDDIMADMNRPK
jgi:hypothetical protein